ncbi:MAG: ferrochelatase [Gammaproteobacteria bacterium]|nr:ferrochelatase [Gammaproteobacteria bacterium]
MHTIKKNIGVLLTNTGTPSAPTTKAVRAYLREFLSDSKVIQLPRWLWLPILYGFVLTTRPQQSAKLYQKIWTADGSPMRINMQEIAEQLALNLSHDLQANVFVEVGMNYGVPSIENALKKLAACQLDHLIILPLYPQFTQATTGSSIDKVKRQLGALAIETKSHSITNYAAFPAYINALAESTKRYWREMKVQPEHLLVSFHGIPKRYVEAGDPYQQQCEITAKHFIHALQWPEEKWTLCYQSRFGYEKWLQPALPDVLIKLSQQNISQVDVICPGFSVDCLETLEEIAIRSEEFFLENGGRSLRYIPALNALPAHIKALAKLVVEELKI